MLQPSLDLQACYSPVLICKHATARASFASILQPGLDLQACYSPGFICKHVAHLLIVETSSSRIKRCIGYVQESPVFCFLCHILQLVADTIRHRFDNRLTVVIMIKINSTHTAAVFDHSLHQNISVFSLGKIQSKKPLSHPCTFFPFNLCSTIEVRTGHGISCDTLPCLAATLKYHPHPLLYDTPEPYNMEAPQ